MRHKLFLLMFLATSVITSLGSAQSPARVRWSVTELGAVADEKFDNTAVFQKALDEAGAAGGGIVEAPAGRFRFAGTLRIPAGVTLQGTYRVPPTIASKSDKPDGTVLLAFAGRGSEQGAPFIQLAGRNSVVSGVAVIYPEWKQTDVPPIPYPPCIASENTENVGITECCLLNPYEGIRLVRAHRHLVRNVTGYPIKRGIYVDECYDIGHIENVHYWPFGVAYNPDDPFCKWVNTQGVAFELARTDWHYVSNTFCFGYGVGYKFSQSKSGSTNGNFLGLGADSCRRAVLVEQAQPPGLLITNGEFVGRWSSKDSVCVEIGKNVEGKVSLVNCSFWGPIDRCVWMRSPFGQFTASACNFVHWDNDQQGSPAIQLDAGRNIVQSCTFELGGMHVQVAEPVRSAMITGNQAQGGFHIENAAGKRTQALANEIDLFDAEPLARNHYRVAIGQEGDDPFLRFWHGREHMGAEPNARHMRWSQGKSVMRLPVASGRAYRLALELNAPPQTVDAASGIYLGEQRIAPLKAGEQTISVEIPAQTGDCVMLELRCQAWVPKQRVPASNDDRTLGVSAFSLTMRAADATDKLFDVNAGAWAPARP